MIAILDTSVVIEGDLLPLEEMLSISVATMAELHYGVLVAKDGLRRAERLERMLSIQRRFSPLPIDEVVAESYAKLAVAVAATGRQPRSRTMDLLIAATAHAHQARLYTRNAEDLRGLETLLEIISI
ncbi:MAG: type II toxin-antitoxin system VapC family toxin [Candidatus Dormibacteraceae bacterium]